ncbi:MAG: KpsF/GutQ family sugar-phosphate isomerase [Planctomycetota bacterium]|nr:KpsF/GutQ family sugar-phosphate isomerase [Planctomycetota bacterium]
MSDRLRVGREVIEQEARALEALARGLGRSFEDAVERLASASGRVLVSGIGKSGSIAQKVAGTLASTGTPALFLHPIDALHGDLGVVGEDDVLLALSKSGHTEELIRFLRHFQRVGGEIISVCEDAASPVALLSDVVLEIPALGEAGPLSLAPTTSSVLQLAMADALAMSLLDARGFTAEQFARFHPEGSLGRRLLIRCEDLLHQGDELPQVREDQTVADLLVEMSSKGLGMSCIVDDSGAYQGVFTDGDLRRLLTRSASPVSLPVSQAWQLSRRDVDSQVFQNGVVDADSLAVDALSIMRQEHVTCLVALHENGAPRGVVRLVDMIREGLYDPATG